MIEIQNPKSIKMELDAIGINSKHIYYDYDHVAKYIANQYWNKVFIIGEKKQVSTAIVNNDMGGQVTYLRAGTRPVWSKTGVQNLKIKGSMTLRY